jgi:hypothetical protein
VLLELIEQEVVQAAGIDWRGRLQRLVRLTCGVERPDLPYVDHDMLMLEHQIAEQKHHRRVFDELSAAWRQSFAARHDLPRAPSPETVQALFVAVGDARRYLLLVQLPHFDTELWAAETERLCITAAQP